ncbi:MAG: sigma-54-dependent transcriptional regulator [Thermodesulfobacteriota bacterium]
MERILIVDDDLSLCHFLTKALSQKGYSVALCHNGRDALNAVYKQEIDLILLDNKLPDRNGLEILKEIKQNQPKVSVIIMTAFGTTETAIQAMKIGAFDYILKPFELDEISELVSKGLEAHRLMKRAVAIPSLSEVKEDSDQLIGKSKVMQEIYKLIGQVAESDVTVLIRGESGTGKELVARAIYQHSLRKDRSFLAINCAAIPETLLESELFGFEKGAFTGANKRRIGKFEQCDKGTILLDEIGDMSLSTQAKILRVLQEGEFERIGGNETVKVDVRLLTATNRKLEELIKEGKFREDLYYRLKIMSIPLPPLREHKEDIKDLTEYFFHLYSRQLGTKVSHIDPSVFEKLVSYSWPGNVRELANTVKRSLILCKGEVITAEDTVFDAEGEPIAFSNEEELERTLVNKLDPLFTDILRFWGSGIHSNLLEKIEKFIIRKALIETGGNQVHAAKLLGISRNTLRHRIERYGL